MPSSTLVRIFPVAGAIAVPAEVWGTPDANPFVLAEIRDRLFRRAADRGLKPGKFCRHHVARLLAGVPPIVVEELIPDEALARHHPADIRRIRLREAKAYRARVIDRIAVRAGSRWTRQGRVFLDAKNQPASIVGYPGYAPSIDLDDLAYLARVAAAWELEAHASVEHWYAPCGRGLAIELCRPGCSILAKPATPAAAG
jgi:hypothetical protein